MARPDAHSRDLQIQLREQTAPHGWAVDVGRVRPDEHLGDRHPAVSERPQVDPTRGQWKRLQLETERVPRHQPPGGGTAARNGAFFVSNPAPTLTAIDLAAANRLDSGVTVLFTGANFLAGTTTVDFGDAGVIVSSFKAVFVNNCWNT